MKDQVGTYDNEDLAMKNEEPIRKGRDLCPLAMKDDPRDDRDLGQI